LENEIRIGTKRIGDSIFIIAEVGVNHNGSLKRALRMVDEAARSGADAVKFQTFTPELLVSKQAPKADYQKGSSGRNQLEMLVRLALSHEHFQELSKRAEKRHILMLSTAFDEESVDFLETLNVPAYKIGSGDLTNFPLIEHVAKKGKPVILSTGMGTLDEVSRAVAAIREQGNQRVILLQCVSSYPSDPAASNLRAMQTLREAFHVPVGFSDHTLGIEVALAAAALGAVVIEKHFTLSRKLTGPDHKASLEPEDFKQMVRGVRTVEEALGKPEKVPTEEEMKMRLVSRRSIVAWKEIGKGEVITREMLAMKRPGTGIQPSDLPSLLGKRAARRIKPDEVLTWEMVEGA
jgi:N,N'-diacetyllegionaminate synthase